MKANVEPAKMVTVIACGVLTLDLRVVARKLGTEIALESLPGGLHERPLELKRRLQERIDVVSASTSADRIVVGYGICGMGTVGIYARSVPLVIPRINDCIALFLGSDAAYRRQFSQYPGTYYVSAGWVEEKSQPQATAEQTIKCGPECFTFQDLTTKYGHENAKAIRNFLNSWQRNYQRAVMIDTGVPGRGKYAAMAQAMANQFGWKYEEIEGSHDLFNQLLTAQNSTDEVLLVPPYHVTAYDAVARTLKAVPVWEADGSASRGDHTLVFEDGIEASTLAESFTGLGLGIDAGGTYTDVVIYDFQNEKMLAKAKALTTKWDFTVGICKALDRLDAVLLRQIDLVSISTTLATNAIVEDRGQKVGLLIFPPYGLLSPTDIQYQPLEVLEGRLDVDGRELVPVNPDEVRQVVHRMMKTHQVSAFAVSGYAGHVNPSHELQVKAIIRQEFGVSVTCAHEVSDKPNYRVRSVTAALNARIIPCLDAFLEAIDSSLHQRGIDSARMVVKSDGSLMSLAMARNCPIETILSGPAASVAGASYLANVPNAMVVDMGGTTTDTATIRGGRVCTCNEGALVGGWRTHVKALDLRTVGLGGDSLIAQDRDGELRVGPLRVAPVALTFASSMDVANTFDWLTTHLDRFRISTRGMELLVRTEGTCNGALDDKERQILDLLADGPRCLDELAQRLDIPYWHFLPLERLEQMHLVQRSGLTPTDLLHVAGHLDLWNSEAAHRFCGLFCRLLGVSQEQLASTVHEQIVRRLAVELLKKQLAEKVDPEEVDTSPAAALLVQNWLDGDNDDYRVRMTLRYPIIGIGAPVHNYLPEAARLLETDAVIPTHADVANAIGAITSRVCVEMKLEISPTEEGRYSLSGLPNSPTFDDFQKAHRHAINELQRLVRQRAFAAGTAETRIEIRIHDRIAPVTDGSMIFLGRDMTAHLSGRPMVKASAR